MITAGVVDQMNVDAELDGKVEIVQNVYLIQAVKMVNVINHGHAIVILAGEESHVLKS